MSQVLSGQGHVLGKRFSAAAVDPGQDAVDPGGMTPGLDVYCGYAAGAPGYRGGSFSNMTAIKSRFPGKKYICVGTDVIDIEPGLAGAGDGPGFVEGWNAARAADPGAYNLDKPMLYADGSDMGSVRSALDGAGIARSRYYLWLAAWNGGPIPAGYDGIQNGNTQGYDSDLFNSYIFGGGGTASVFPLQLGSSGPQVAALQVNLNRWAHLLGLKALVAGDGSYGPITAAAVALAQAYFHDRSPIGECSQALYSALAKALPAPAFPGFSVTPSNERRTIDLHFAVVPGTVHYLVSSSPASPAGEEIVTDQKVTYELPLAGTVTVTCEAIGVNGQAIAKRTLVV